MSELFAEESPKPKTFSILLDMVPTPKGSVRFDGRRSFLPDKTRVAMHDVKMQSSKAKDELYMSGKIDSATDPIFTTAIEADIVYSFIRPKSVKPHKRPHPCVKPDIDNLTKLLFDGLQPHIMKDDSLVCKVNKRKVYGDTAFVSITITELLP